MSLLRPEKPLVSEAIGQDGLAQRGPGGAGVQADGGASSALIPATASSGMRARDPCRSVARSRNRAVLVAFLGCGAGAGRGRGAAAGGDRAFLQDPGAEPGQGGGGGHGQAEQPQGQAAEDGQGGGRVGGQGRAQLRWRAIAQARTTPIRVSLASA